MQTNSQSRVLWADYAKGIAITLMILGHIPLENHDVRDFIYSFHMPVFFVISGLFSSYKSLCWKDFLLKSARQLVIPYILLYILTFPIGLIPIYVHPELYGYPTWTDLLWKPVVGMLLCENIAYTSFSIFTTGQLWFLVALFWVKIYSFATRQWNHIKRIVVALFIAAIFVLGFHRYLHINIYYSLDSAAFAIPFYLFGELLGKNTFFDTVIKKKKSMLFLMSMGLFLFLWFSSMLNDGIDVGGSNCGKSLLFSYFNGIIGSVALFFFCASLPTMNYLANMGKSSLLILAFHGIPLYIIRFILLRLFDVPLTKYSLYIAILISIGSSVVLTPFLIQLMKKYPVIIGKK